MADLRAVVEGLGYSDVRTLLNSGNVVFTGAPGKDISARLEEALAARTGVSAKVIVLTGLQASVSDPAAKPAAAAIKQKLDLNNSFIIFLIRIDERH